MQKASFDGLQQGCRHPDPNFRPFSESPWLFLTSHLACILFNCPMMQFWFFFLKWLFRDSVYTCTVIQIKLVVVVSRSRLNLLQNPESWDSNEGNPGSRDSNEGNPRSREGKSRIPKFKFGEITSPDIQVREIPDPEKPTGDPPLCVRCLTSEPLADHLFCWHGDTQHVGENQ